MAVAKVDQTFEKVPPQAVEVHVGEAGVQCLGQPSQAGRHQPLPVQPAGGYQGVAKVEEYRLKCHADSVEKRGSRVNRPFGGGSLRSILVPRSVRR